MKIYIYDDYETAVKVAKTIWEHFGVAVERTGTALKVAEELYDKLVDKTYAPRAAWIAQHLS